MHVGFLGQFLQCTAQRDALAGSGMGEFAEGGLAGGEGGKEVRMRRVEPGDQGFHFGQAAQGIHFRARLTSAQEPGQVVGGVLVTGAGGALEHRQCALGLIQIEHHHAGVLEQRFGRTLLLGQQIGLRGSLQVGLDAVAVAMAIGQHQRRLADAVGAEALQQTDACGRFAVERLDPQQHLRHPHRGLASGIGIELVDGIEAGIDASRVELGVQPQQGRQSRGRFNMSEAGAAGQPVHCGLRIGRVPIAHQGLLRQQHIGRTVAAEGCAAQQGQARRRAVRRQGQQQLGLGQTAAKGLEHVVEPGLAVEAGQGRQHHVCARIALLRCRAQRAHDEWIVGPALFRGQPHHALDVGIGAAGLGGTLQHAPERAIDGGVGVRITG